MSLPISHLHGGHVSLPGTGAGQSARPNKDNVLASSFPTLEALPIVKLVDQQQKQMEALVSGESIRAITAKAVDELRKADADPSSVIGEALKELFYKEKKLSLGEIAEETPEVLISVMALAVDFAEKLSDLNEHYLEIAAEVCEGSEYLNSWLGVAVLSHKYSVAGKQIQQLKEEIHSLEGQIDGPLKEAVLRKLDEKKDKLRTLEHRHKGAVQTLTKQIITMTLVGLKHGTELLTSDIGQEMLRVGPQFVEGLLITAPAISVATSAFGLAFSTYQAVRSSGKRSQLLQNLAELKADRDQAKVVAANVLLQLKIDRAEVLFKELTGDLIRQIVNVSSSLVSLSSSIQALLIAAGVSLSAASPLFIIGGLVVSGCVLVGGLGYSAYSHKREIAEAWTRLVTASKLGTLSNALQENVEANQAVTYAMEQVVACNKKLAELHAEKKALEVGTDKVSKLRICLSQLIKYQEKELAGKLEHLNQQIDRVSKSQPKVVSWRSAQAPLLERRRAAAERVTRHHLRSQHSARYHGALNGLHTILKESLVDGRSQAAIKAVVSKYGFSTHGAIHMNRVLAFIADNKAVLQPCSTAL